MFLWVIIDFYLFFIENKNSSAQLIYGKVMFVRKNTGYHRCELSMKVKCSDNNIIQTTSFFKPNVRWWMQFLPKVGDNVYFYTVEKLSTDNNDNGDKIAFGIANHKPEIGKLRWDLFAYRSSTRTIIIFAILFLCLFIVLKFTPFAIFIPKEFFLFVIVRLSIEILFI